MEQAAATDKSRRADLDLPRRGSWTRHGGRDHRGEIKTLGMLGPEA
jgi:hypothetical protein